MFQKKSPNSLRNSLIFLPKSTRRASKSTRRASNPHSGLLNPHGGLLNPHGGLIKLERIFVLKIHCPENILFWQYTPKVPIPEIGRLGRFSDGNRHNSSTVPQKQKSGDKLSIYQGVAQNLGWVHKFRRTVDGEIW